MSTTKDHVDPIEHAPGVSGGDVFRYLPVLMKVIEALQTGTGTFSTATKWGKRWIRIQAEPFKD